MYNYIPHLSQTFPDRRIPHPSRRADSFLIIAPSVPGCEWVDRTKDEFGFCGSGYLPIVASYCVHHGEEPVLWHTKKAQAQYFLKLQFQMRLLPEPSDITAYQSLKKNDEQL